MNAQSENYPIVHILHISDVHFGSADPRVERVRIINGIQKALDEKHVDLDYIVFTGDLAQAGKEAEFAEGGAWLFGLASRFQCPVLLVPGNHDTMRVGASKSILRRAYPTEESYNHSRSDLKLSGTETALHLQPFMKWFKEARSTHPELLNKWSERLDVELVRDSSTGFAIAFVCVNTASLSCDVDDKGKLCIDIAALNESLGKVDNENTLVIGLGHHPLEWLAPWNNNIATSIIKQETGFHVYMHGHLHAAVGAADYQNTGAGILISEAGSAYPGSEWKTQFSVVDIDLKMSTTTITIFQWATDSGKWFDVPSMSRPIPTRLPKPESCAVPATNESKILSVTPPDESIAIDVPGKSIFSWTNPFSDLSANGMEADAVHTLFVDQANSVAGLSHHRDAIVEGQRGTGKTMLLRYFSLEVQASIAKSVSGAALRKHIHTKKLPFGIYCCISKAGLNRSDLDAITDNNRREAVFIHRFVLFVICRLMVCLGILERGLSERAETADLQRYMLRLFRLTRPPATESMAEFCLRIVEEANFLISSVDEHVMSMLPGYQPTPFNPWLTIQNGLSPLLEKIKTVYDLNSPFFLLIDDFDVLNAEQQSALFKAAAVRDNSLICYKFGVMEKGQKTFLAGLDRTYRVGADYDLIKLNWVDHGLTEDTGGGTYSKLAEEVCKKRMRRANWPVELNLKSLFNEWESGEKTKLIVKINAENEYNSLPKKDRPLSFKSYWDKQGNAKFLRHLKANKTEYRYAGYRTIIELSSGIFRQLLEVCSKITDNAFATGWSPANVTKNKATMIGARCQSSAIKAWSKDMFRSLGETGDISAISKTSHEITNLHLINLADGLSKFFANRLFSDSRDPEVIAIAVRDTIEKDSFVRALLDLAVRESVLQRRDLDYSNKSGGTKLPTYLLNRRLAPYAGIGTKLQGRHELGVADIELVARDPEAFLKRMTQKSRPTDPNQTDFIDDESD